MAHLRAQAGGRFVMNTKCTAPVKGAPHCGGGRELSDARYSRSRRGIEMRPCHPRRSRARPQFRRRLCVPESSCAATIRPWWWIYPAAGPWPVPGPDSGRWLPHSSPPTRCALGVSSGLCRGPVRRDAQAPPPGLASPPSDTSHTNHPTRPTPVATPSVRHTNTWVHADAVPASPPAASQPQSICGARYPETNP